MTPSQVAILFGDVDKYPNMSRENTLKLCNVFPKQPLYIIKYVKIRVSLNSGLMPGVSVSLIQFRA